MRRKRAVVALAATVGVLVVLTVVVTVHHFQTVGTPQTVAAVPPAPTVHVRDDYCTGQDWTPRVNGGGGGRVTVDAHPTGAVVFWMPVLGQGNCRVVVSDLTGTQANLLADAVRHTRTTGGTYACPNDNGSAAWVFFRYAGRSDLDVLDANLSGCPFVSAPRRGSIGPAWRVAGALQDMEPPSVPGAAQ